MCALTHVTGTRSVRVTISRPAEHTRRDQNQNCTGAALRGERRSGCTSAWRRRRVQSWRAPPCLREDGPSAQSLEGAAAVAAAKQICAHSCRWLSLTGGLDGTVRYSVSESRDSRSTAGDTCAGRGSRRLADATLLADRHGLPSFLVKSCPACDREGFENTPGKRRSEDVRPRERVVSCCRYFAQATVYRRPKNIPGRGARHESGIISRSSTKIDRHGRSRSRPVQPGGRTQV